MVHPALLRTSTIPGSAAGWSPAGRPGRGPAEHAKRLLRRLNRWLAPDYRPEQHYMRGGRTAGAKSLAAG
jgi:hypothetical protein